MTKLRTLFLTLPFVAIAACATTTPSYERAAGPEDYGYRDTAIESDRYRITYRGRDAGTARDYALLRAAELTLSKGYDWFEVVGTDTERTSARRGGTGVTIGGSTGTYGSRGGVGIGIGIPIGGTSSRTGSYVSLEIIIRQGEKPNQPNAYDAFTVQQNIRGQINSGG